MPELLIIAAILLLLFGASRLPQLGASIGSAIRNFKKGFSGEGEGNSQPTQEASKLASSSRIEGSASEKSSTKNS
jgi:sec-independent protein translocase protein TatA